MPGPARLEGGDRLFVLQCEADVVEPEPVASGAARPVLEGLRDETGESAQLFVRDGDSRLCVAASERPAGPRDTVPVGAVLRIDRGSGGKVLLAFAGDGAGAGSADRFPGVDRAELETIRRRGWRRRWWLLLGSSSAMPVWRRAGERLRACIG